MYLISIYFDEKTEQRIRSMMKQVAGKTGNTYMIDGDVPPHITLSAFETTTPQKAIDALDKVVPELKSGKLTWASVAAFFPSVIYVAPVLNQYLQIMSETIFGSLKDIEGIRLRANYQPFNWMPHTTIGKKLTREEMKVAFEVLQHSFGMFEGQVVGIGLAKTNPYEDIRIWELSRT